MVYKGIQNSTGMENHPYSSAVGPPTRQRSKFFRRGSKVRQEEDLMKRFLDGVGIVCSCRSRVRG